MHIKLPSHFKQLFFFFQQTLVFYPQSRRHLKQAGSRPKERHTLPLSSLVFKEIFPSLIGRGSPSEVKEHVGINTNTAKSSSSCLTRTQIREDK